MYKCLECGNVDRFEELNVIKTLISQDNNYIEDKFVERVDVLCSECGENMETGTVIEIE